MNDIDFDEIPDDPFNNAPKKRINSKKKGNRWENQVCKILGSAFDDVFRRVPMSGGFVGGKNKFRNYFVNEDAQSQLTGDLITPSWFPFIVECKNYNDSPKVHNLLSIGDKDLDQWIKQAKDEAKTAKKEWLIIFNMTSKRKSFAVVDFDRFYFLINNNKVLFPNNYIVYKNSIILDFDQFTKKFMPLYFPQDWENIRDQAKAKRSMELLNDKDFEIEPESL
jgi:hypothetical protein